MAVSSRAAAIPILKRSNAAAIASYSPTISNAFLPLKTVSWKSEMAQRSGKDVFSAGVKGGLGSLKGGTGVLERPTFDQSQFDPLPQVLEGGDIGRLGDRKNVGGGDSYRVLLIDDACHTEKLVVKALPQVVPSITNDHARKLFHESRKHGASLVIVIKEHAEFYAQMMLLRGLRSAIEPDSDLA